MIEIEHKAQSNASDMKSDHIHNCVELYFLVSGGRRYFIGHSIYDVAPGNIVIVSKNELHHTVVRGTKGYDRYLISFDDSEVASLIDDIGREKFKQLTASGCYQFSPSNVALIKNAVENAAAEYRYKREYCNAYIRQYLREILLTVLRYGNKKTHSESEVAVKIQSAAQHISENFGNDISLADAAEIACMETTYFSKRFKKLTGFGFSEYLKEIRLREAKRMLKDTELQISDISQLCGFSCSNYFGDVFKRAVGMSPTEYRTKNKTDA